MRKINIIIFGSLILATAFGIFGQDMAYWLNENIFETHPIYYLTALTIISILLYLCCFIYIYFQYKKQTIEKVWLSLYFTLFGCISLFTSFWSLFVLAMWWG